MVQWHSLTCRMILSHIDKGVRDLNTARHLNGFGAKPLRHLGFLKFEKLQVMKFLLNWFQGDDDSLNDDSDDNWPGTSTDNNWTDYDQVRFDKAKAIVAQLNP